MFNQIKEFPHDFFVPLEGNPNHLGRLTLLCIGEGDYSLYNVEIDIVEKEAKKIFQHIGILYNFNDIHEAMDQSMQKLADFISQQKKFL